MELHRVIDHERRERVHPRKALVLGEQAKELAGAADRALDALVLALGVVDERRVESLDRFLQLHRPSVWFRGRAVLLGEAMKCSRARAGGLDAPRRTNKGFQAQAGAEGRAGRGGRPSTTSACLRR